MKVGVHPCGRDNHILDVPGGLGLAHRSFREPLNGVCTGFTVLQPSFELNRRRAAAVFALNAAGELTGTHQINEWGFLDTPITLTNTTSAGRAYDVVSQWMMRKVPAIGETSSVVIPVVGECDDSVLHDPRAAAWGGRELFDALDESHRLAEQNQSRTATLPRAAFAQGDVGGGTGMIAFDLKAGIGSASRVVLVAGMQVTVGVLLQTNFGTREQLTVLGRNVGPSLKQELPRKHREGSCIGVLATNAPLSPLGLRRLAKRMSLGLARAGGHAHHGSGEIFLAFSTADRSTHELSWETDEWNPLLQSAVEATEEAVYGSLLGAKRVANARATVAALEPADVSG
ncbi:MAG: P1 family peptidase [Deltaproteobacteria bacterium]|nr:P1 family peptidase [Deltaproteobacteria bacterium]